MVQIFIKIRIRSWKHSKIQTCQLKSPLLWLTYQLMSLSLGFWNLTIVESPPLPTLFGREKYKILWKFQIIQINFNLWVKLLNLWCSITSLLQDQIFPARKEETIHKIIHLILKQVSTKSRVQLMIFWTMEMTIKT